MSKRTAKLLRTGFCSTGGTAWLEVVTSRSVIKWHKRSQARIHFQRRLRPIHAEKPHLAELTRSEQMKENTPRRGESSAPAG